jgi:hypothetical protein
MSQTLITNRLRKVKYWRLPAHRITMKMVFRARMHNLSTYINTLIQQLTYREESQPATRHAPCLMQSFLA